MRRIFGAMCLALAAWPLTARAAWHEASSAHFVIYADDSPSDLRRFSEQLERYHSAMAFVTTGNHPTPSPSNRVTVYVVRDLREVRTLHGGGDPTVAGFYSARAGSSLAVVSSITAISGRPDFSMIALLHEYAHHFLIASSGMPMPRWWSEGAAEFFSSASFESNGGIWIGRPALHRGLELRYARDVTAGDLLDPAAYERRANKSYDAFYGKSWLLYHYLTFDEARKGQTDKYIAAIGKGVPLRAAGLEAFGDFDALEKDLDRYYRKPRMSALNLKAAMLNVGAITVRRLSEGESAVMPLLMRSKVGVNEEGAKALAPKMRAVAARYPQEAAVLSALSEAEYDAGNDREAIAAADAALAIDPAQVNAYVQKGYALFRMAGDADDQKAAYARARSVFVKLNRREPDHPLPLWYFYRSYKDQGASPPPVAVDGLVRALELAPFDLELRMTVARELIERGRRDEAKIALRPVAYNPHGGALSGGARRLIERLDREPGWKGEGMMALIANDETAETAK